VAQFQVECIESTTDKDQAQYSRFILEPLDRGQGTTIGNALRRVLLSNLEGTAITALRIDGVSHEFSAVPGVREDVLDIMLNMKKVVLKSYSAQPQIGRLVVQGPAVVTAANFDLPSDVEVISTDQYIATIAPGAKLEMEFQVQRGKGYRSVDRIREDQATSVDFLQLDSIFMPVRKVNYTVEDTRVGAVHERDRLLMEVWTNGSLTPQEALGQAANILVDLFNPLKDVNFEPSEDDVVTDTPSEHQIPIEELQLSVRAYNCLKRAQINSVADLLDYTQEDLMEIKNFGAKSAEEVVEALKDRLGITLPLTKAAKENGGI
jgi:DNA-directed RNA polymerase subunit alpha